MRKRRFLSYLIGFVFILFLISLIANRGLQYLDFYAYKHFYFSDENEQFGAANIFVIDLPEENEESKESYRIKIANLLNDINSKVNETVSDASQNPHIILDFSFASDTQGLDTLEKSINVLKSKKVNVYAVYDIVKLTDDTIKNFKANERERASQLYKEVFTNGRLHTTIDVHPSGIVWYDSFKRFRKSIIDSTELNVRVWALPIKVAENLGENIEIDRFNPKTIVLPVGNMEGLKNRTWKYLIDKDSIGESTYNFQPESGNQNVFDVSNNIFIIGDFENDQHKVGKNNTIPGPYLLAWALYDQLRDNKLAKQPMDNGWIHFGIALFCVLIITGIFELVFLILKKLKSKPFLIGLISATIGLIVLYGFIILMPENKVIRPSFPAISMILASIFIAFFKKKFIKDPTAEGGGIDDIFISYSRKHSDWVTQYILDYLKDYTTKNGKSLKIFFDVESIRAGENFTAKIKERIFNSNAFMPIVSWPEYFDKDRIYCLLEFEQADSRIVANNMEMFPITYDINYIPKQYRTMDWIIVDKDNPQFYDKLDQWLESVFGGDKKI